MDVKELKEFIKDLPDDMPVFIGCEGYSNYNFKENKQFDDQDTIIKVQNGKLFITDPCVYENERR